MTPIILLDRLEEFVKKVTGDIKLQVKVRNLNPEEEKERTANVYKMRLPKKKIRFSRFHISSCSSLTGRTIRKKKSRKKVCARSGLLLRHIQKTAARAHMIS